MFSSCEMICPSTLFLHGEEPNTPLGFDHQSLWQSKPSFIKRFPDQLSTMYCHYVTTMTGEAGAMAKPGSF